jgi:hypothetical protein
MKCQQVNKILTFFVYMWNLIIRYKVEKRGTNLGCWSVQWTKGREEENPCDVHAPHTEARKFTTSRLTSTHSAL